MTHQRRRISDAEVYDLILRTVKSSIAKLPVKYDLSAIPNEDELSIYLDDAVVDCIYLNWEIDVPEFNHALCLAVGTQVEKGYALLSYIEKYQPQMQIIEPDVNLNWLTSWPNDYSKCRLAIERACVAIWLLRKQDLYHDYLKVTYWKGLDAALDLAVSWQDGDFKVDFPVNKISKTASLAQQKLFEQWLDKLMVKARDKDKPAPKKKPTNYNEN